MSKINEIQVLLSKKAELNARLSLLPYDGTPEIKTISGRKTNFIKSPFYKTVLLFLLAFIGAQTSNLLM